MNSSKNIKSQQPILIDPTHTQYIDYSTQKTQSQLQSLTQSKKKDKFADLDLNDLEIDF